MNRTLIFAHRGANREATENTREAFEKALLNPVDGIETDIQLSRDDIAVLWHDDDLGKLGMPENRIDDFDYARLDGMDFDVMRLSDFVADFGSRCRLLLEIKKYPGESDARQRIKVLQTLELADTVAEDRVLVSSFDLDSLILAHRLDPRQALVLNLEPEHHADFAHSTLSAHPFLHGVCVHISTLDPGMSDAVGEGGKFLGVYTCNSDEEIYRALAFSVNALITDLPQEALRLRDG